MTALMRARWVKACGKLPRCRPLRGSISSAYRPSGLANDSSFSHSCRARSRSPISASAETSQNEQMVKRALLARQAVVGLLDPVAQDQSVDGELVGDGEHGRPHARVVGREEPDQRHQQQRGVERVGVVVLGEDATLVDAVRADVGVDLVGRGLPALGQRRRPRGAGPAARLGRRRPSTSASTR